MTSEQLLESVHELTGLDRDTIVKRWRIPYNMVDDLFSYRNRLGQMVPFTPYQYWQDYVNSAIGDEYSDLTVLKSRQIGITTSAEIVAILKMMTYYDTEVAVISHMYDKATEFVQEAGNIIQNAAVPLPFSKKNVQKTKITCDDTGTSLVPYSSKPDSIRGGDAVCVILDEFAFVPYQEETLAAVGPKITRGGQIIMQSTPLRKDDIFMKTFEDMRTGVQPGRALYLPLFDPNEVDYSRAPSEQTCAPICRDVDMSIIDREWMKSIDRYKQEYMCIPADEVNAYYPYDLIMACTLDKMPHTIGTISMGIDHAIARDETAVYINNELGGANYIVYSEVMQGDYHEQLKAIDAIYSRWRPDRIRADATGEMGKQVEIDLKKRYGYIVEGVTYTNEVKREMALRLKYYMQNTVRGVKPCVHIPSDPELIDQLHSVKIEVTDGGVQRISGKQKGRLDDRVNGLWLTLPDEPYATPAMPVIKHNPALATRHPDRVDPGIAISIKSTHRTHRRERGYSHGRR